ncbi:MAG: hypothetical protein COV35_05330 [Alphaproteobacteria bacterium CG11_big_fil_rev_8_21_14_0_20_39_49]|nr:MAG: hypothetical protein COV35_05330 [Alphaproteobacteria bacterium CG11_big_fil_rev_8_21_14_0_20_39_49]
MEKDKKSIGDLIYNFGFIAVALLAFFVYKASFFFAFFYYEGLNSYILLMLTGFVFVLLGAKIKDTDITCTILRRLGKMVAIGLAFYLVVEPTTYVSVQKETDLLADILRYGDFPSIIFALIAIRRPVFFMLPALHIVAAREMVDTISGITMAFHDIYYLSDAGFLFAFCIVLLEYFKRKNKYTSEQINIAYQSIAYVSIGVHIANYFWSGIAKMRLDGSPFEWLLENDISQLYIVAVYKGVAPLGTPPQLAQFVYDSLSSGHVFFNAVTLVVQLLSILFILKISWLRISAVIFDIFHIGVYVIGGILFWPWIWMNISILVATHKVRDAEIYDVSKIAAVVTILLGGMGLFHTAFLGWYDVRDTRFVMLQAKTVGADKWVDVPIAYAGAHAYSFSHGNLDKGVRSGHFPPNVAGLSYSADERRLNGECKLPPVDESKLETPEDEKIRLDNVERFVKAIHQDVLEDMNMYGKYSYYMRLHHHQSNPLLYEEFHNIDPRDIEYIKVITRSACTDMVEGKIKDKIIKQDEQIIKVR